MQDDPVPPAGFLTLTVRHRTGARCARTAEKNLQRAKRHRGKRRKVLVFQIETEFLGIKCHGASNIFDLISNAMKVQMEFLGHTRI